MLALPIEMRDTPMKSFAVSLSLRVVACAFDCETRSDLVIFRLPELHVGTDNTLEVICTIDLLDNAVNSAGWMTFTDDDLLLMTYSCFSAVGVINVRTRRHAGYVCRADTCDGAVPHDVASKGDLVAVSYTHTDDPYVLLYHRVQNECPTWELVRHIGYKSLDYALGLSFSRTSQVLAVANLRGSVFCTETGLHMYDLKVPAGFRTLFDVDECEEGWAMLFSGFGGGTKSAIYFYDHEGQGEKGTSLVLPVSGLTSIQCCNHMVFYGSHTALIVGHTPAGAAMAAMSIARIAWMSAVARGC